MRACEVDVVCACLRVYVCKFISVHEFVCVCASVCVCVCVHVQCACESV